METSGQKRICDRIDSSASIDCMATLTIRRLDDKLKQKLRVQAAYHGRSMEEEAREILRTALSKNEANDKNPEKSLFESIRERFAPFGGVELELPPREPVRDPPDFNTPDFDDFDK